MSLYADGYRPTMNLRVYMMHAATSQPHPVLQQEWQSDYQGFPPVWRDVPYYFPAQGETKGTLPGVCA